MNGEIFDVFPELTIGGLWIGMFVFLVVQVFKYADFIKAIPGKNEDVQQIRLALIVAFIGGLGWLAVTLDAEENPWTVYVLATSLYQMLVGALTATLFYKYVFKPILEKLGINDVFYRAKPE